jgi:hypothetical protein
MNEPVLIKGAADPVNNVIYVKAVSGKAFASARIPVASETANTFEMHAPYSLHREGGVAFSRLHTTEDPMTLQEPKTGLRITVPPGCELDTFLGKRLVKWPRDIDTLNAT